MILFSPIGELPILSDRHCRVSETRAGGTPHNTKVQELSDV